MMEDVRKVLEAVARGEISPEDGERLIRAIQEREKGGKEKREEEKGKNEKGFVLREGEVIDDDLTLSGEKVRVEGKILGDLVLLQCDTFFSGSVGGDMAVIGGKVEFDGGRVEGDLVLIGAKVKGKEPEVLGDRVKITNFLATGILTALSPILGGLRIRSGEKKKVGEVIEEMVILPGDSKKVGFIDVERLVVHGELKSTGVRCESMLISGKAKVDNLVCETLNVPGELRAGNVKVEVLNVDGRMTVHNLRAENISGSGEIRVLGKISYETISPSVRVVYGRGEDAQG